MWGGVVGGAVIAADGGQVLAGQGAAVAAPHLLVPAGDLPLGASLEVSRFPLPARIWEWIGVGCGTVGW